MKKYVFAWKKPDGTIAVRNEFIDNKHLTARLYAANKYSIQPDEFLVFMESAEFEQVHSLIRFSFYDRGGIVSDRR